MSEGMTAAVPLRDAKDSEFSRILAILETQCKGFIAAVFYDELGETIDYHSYLAPFDTRLVGAHHGLFVSSTNSRTTWMDLGSVQFIEVFASYRDSLTVSLGDSLFLTVLVESGTLTHELHRQVDSVIELLRKEIGI